MQKNIFIVAAQRRRATFALLVWTLLLNSGALTANAQPAPAPKPCYDFFGSGRTSFATVRLSSDFSPNYIWDVRNNGGAGTIQTAFGLNSADFVTPGYFDNDNIADIAVWRTGTSSNPQATYLIRPSTAPTTFYGVQWGLSNSGASADRSGSEGDYDGDGRDDPTVIRLQNNNYIWYYLRSSNNTFAAIQFGNNFDSPLPGADYTGDGRHEIGVFRIGTGETISYLLADSVTGAIVVSTQWGRRNTDFVVTGDFLGDRRADFAVWRGNSTSVTPANGIWYIKENGGDNVLSYQWGIPGRSGDARDTPVCGDYSGDGKSDVAVYRPSNSTFYWINSNSATGGDSPTFGIQQSGQINDLPIGRIKVR